MFGCWLGRFSFSWEAACLRYVLQKKWSNTHFSMPSYPKTSTTFSLRLKSILNSLMLY